MSDKTTVDDPILNTTVAGRYEVYAKLGEGGMGAVYAARQQPLARTVALKVLLKQLSEDPIAVKRFEKEALAISRLAHPNTVTIFDYGQTETGTLYIAMEFLEGRTLRQAIELEAPLDPRRAVRVLAQIVRALSEAHQRGVIHRDLKPDNIMLVPTAGEPDFVKVLDFGVAKLRAPQGVDMKTLTQGDVIFGTPRYMSPEQVNGVMDDPRSDLYAVGAIAYEMLAGTALFDGDSAIKILMAHVQQAPRPFASLPKPVAVPKPLEQLVFKLLAKAPEDRFKDADQLLAALDELPGVGGGLRPPSGKTEGMLRPVLTPGDGVAQVGTQMMGSGFAALGVDDPDVTGRAATEAVGAGSGAEETAALPAEGMTLPERPSNLDSVKTTGIETPAVDGGGSVGDQPLTDLDEVTPPRSHLGLYLTIGAVAVVVVVVVALLGSLGGGEENTQRPDASAGNVVVEPGEALLSVTTEPPGARVIIDGDAVGTSPVSRKVSVGRVHVIRAELDGYTPKVETKAVDSDSELALVLQALDAGAAVVDSGEAVAHPTHKRRDAGAHTPPPVTRDAGHRPPPRKRDAAVGVDKKKRPTTPTTPNPNDPGFDPEKFDDLKDPGFKKF